MRLSKEATEEVMRLIWKKLYNDDVLGLEAGVYKELDDLLRRIGRGDSEAVFYRIE